MYSYPPTQRSKTTTFFVLFGHTVVRGPEAWIAGLLSYAADPAFGEHGGFWDRVVVAGCGSGHARLVSEKTVAAHHQACRSVVAGALPEKGQWTRPGSIPAGPPDRENSLGGGCRPNRLSFRWLPSFRKPFSIGTGLVFIQNNHGEGISPQKNSVQLLLRSGFFVDRLLSVCKLEL
jgi:hypothetical protein